MEEYKIISGNETHIQKVLNQWRHLYFLEFIEISINDAGDNIVALIKRTEKSEETSNK